MKPKNFSYLFFLLASLILSAWILAPDPLTEKVETYLKTYRANYATEKVYIHHDKPYYMAGEILWLKAYVVNAASNKSTEKSGVLYVDLMDEEEALVYSLTLPISDGGAFGDILLPENLPEGVYRLSAFTQWMRNFGESGFFQKEIYVFNGTEGQVTSTQKLEERAPSVDLQFFPEGGDLVAGLSNTVAFKALASNGFGLPVSGALFDEAGKKLLEFEDHHDGMGAFSFTPDSGKRYFAKLNFSDGRTVDYALPEVLSEGFVMQLDEVSDPEAVKVSIASNREIPGQLMLMGIAKDSLAYKEPVAFANGQSAEFEIPKDRFPTGIVRFTLTDTQGEPYAERLVFVRHPQKTKVNIKTDKSSYSPREQVDLEISMEEGGFGPELSQFSLSVTTDKWVKPSQSQENIATYLLLSADLKGHIATPGYYFEKDDAERQLALKHLMLTQGWRRFGWEPIVAQEFPKIQYGNEMDLHLKGRLVNSKGEGINKGEALLYLKDRYQTFITTPTNKEGYFGFTGFYFKDTIQVMIQGTDSRGRRDDVEVQMLERTFKPLFLASWIRLPEAYVSQMPDGYVLSTQQQLSAVEKEVGAMDLGELLLQEVVIEGRAEIYEPFTLHTKADVVLHRNQLPIAPSGNILESLQGRVAGLQVTKTGMNEFRSVIRGQGTPLYLLDGMPISESTMQSLNQFDIGRIEILKSPGATGIYGGRGGGGVIAFFTDMGYEELEEAEEDAKYIITHQAAGFNKTRTFYSPVYQETDYYDLPDLRSTVYWNPMVFLSPNSKREMSFYTGDVTGRHRVQVEGITKDGHPISEAIYFEVEGD
ncbi:Plug domain-containing protein [Pararhodonellum marinum]|uniref:Plug domain-containing protein n=1 Tax=Pararhodonellum marinum TaxID=2755358 RepID=UPI00188E0009|nr:Plug domain-containing protein [Pararhodonellum marinum]